jgi:hypothetical protein
MLIMLPQIYSDRKINVAIGDAMGLDLTVGILPAVINSDEQGFEHYQHLFAQVNQALQAEGLPPHHEPIDLQTDIPWFAQMWHYSGLHYLRRIAAYLWADQPLPAPGTYDDERNPDPMNDLIIDHAYCMHYSTDHPFAAAHLMFHSVTEGLYLPEEFADVIYPDRALRIPGDTIGSAAVLQRECAQIARILEIPPDLDPDDDRVWQAAEAQGKQGATMWQHYGIETFTCIRLLRACEISLETGCAIVFN